LSYGHTAVQNNTQPIDAHEVIKMLSLCSMLERQEHAIMTSTLFFLQIKINLCGRCRFWQFFRIFDVRDDSEFDI